ncbi:MAG: RNA 2',3'-cyclic phosphodiesterase [Thermoanaerobaculia bacterium]
MRLFFATFLSQENVAAYQALVDRLISEVPDSLRPIPPASHHLTLAFLGELSEWDVENCRAGFTAAEELAAFSFSLEPPRILMGRGQPRLICADVGVGRKQVSEAQAALVAHLGRSLPSLKVRPKPPHVNLARFKKNARRSEAARIEGAMTRHYDNSHAWEDRFAEIHLVKSSLTPAGPIYETVQKAQLSTGH